MIAKYGRPLSSESFRSAIREMNLRFGSPRNQFFSAKADQPFFVADPTVEKLAGVRTSKTEVSAEERNDKQAQEEQQS